MDNLLKFIAALTEAKVSFSLDFANRGTSRDAFVEMRWSVAEACPSIPTFGAIPLSSGRRACEVGPGEYNYENHFFRL